MLEGTTLPIAFLDTSVLVPAWSRVTLQSLAVGPSPRYRAVWSEWIIAETWRVLTDHLARRGVPRNVIAARANQMMHYLLPAMHLVSLSNVAPTSLRPPSTDPNDVLVWATAVLGNAQFVVSHNTRHFPPLVRVQLASGDHPVLAHRHRYEGVEFLTAIEFVEDVLGEDAASTYGRPLPPRGIIRSRRSVPRM